MEDWEILEAIGRRFDNLENVLIQIRDLMPVPKIPEPTVKITAAHRGVPPDHVFGADGKCLYCPATQGAKSDG